MVDRQHVFHQLAPLDNHHFVRVTNNFIEFIGHDTRLTQSIKIEVMKLFCASAVHFTNGKGWARNPVWAAETAGKTAHEGGFTATQVTQEFNDFTAFKILPELLAELLGVYGTGRFCLPRRSGIHTLHIVMPVHQRQQVPRDAVSLLGYCSPLHSYH